MIQHIMEKVIYIYDGKMTVSSYIYVYTYVAGQGHYTTSVRISPTYVIDVTQISLSFN